MKHPKVNLVELRTRALAAMRSEQGASFESYLADLAVDTPRLVEELSIYQTELEMQNQDLVQSQDQLARTGRKYQALFSGLPVPALLCDAQGFIHEMNGEAQACFRLRDDAVVQRYSFLHLIDPGYRQQAQRALAAACTGQPLQDQRLQISIQGGTRAYFDLRLRMLDDHASGTPLLMAVLVDRTTEVAYAEQSHALEVARKNADLASQAKGLFLAKMSHELRTPLSGVLGLVTLLQQSRLDDRQKHWLGLMETAGQHLNMVINDILDLSKIESGQLRLEHEWFDVSDVVHSAMELLEPKAREQGGSIECQIAHNVPRRLKGDAGRLRQALFNYLSNAIKFGRGQVVLVTVECVWTEGPEAMLRFAVKDHGPGIAPDLQRLLFKPFQQLDESLTRQTGGTGLGLNITRQLAVMMGGDAGLDSVVGRGSTFWFTAKLGCEEAIGEPGLQTTGASGGFSQPRKAPPHVEANKLLVLLCEDDMISREVALNVLSMAGCRVMTAGDGEAALALAQETRFDLVLMDMQLPILDGVSATAAMRKLSGWEEVPIVALTANTCQEDELACQHAGMTGFLSKPLTPAKCHDLLATCKPA